MAKIKHFENEIKKSGKNKKEMKSVVKSDLFRRRLMNAIAA